mgnify:CR=1 FL=1
MLEKKQEIISEEDKKIQDQVEEITTTTFSIQGVPIRVFKRFLRFCEDNAKITKVWRDRTGQKQIREELCYSIGLAMLLDAWETDAKHQLLFDRIVKLEDKLNGNK